MHADISLLHALLLIYVTYINRHCSSVRNRSCKHCKWRQGKSHQHIVAFLHLQSLPFLSGFFLIFAQSFTFVHILRQVNLMSYQSPCNVHLQMNFLSFSTVPGNALLDKKKFPFMMLIFIFSNMNCPISLVPLLVP